jgi:hypothetical protein
MVRRRVRERWITCTDRTEHRTLALRLSIHLCRRGIRGGQRRCKPRTQGSSLIRLRTSTSLLVSSAYCPMSLRYGRIRSCSGSPRGLGTCGPLHGLTGRLDGAPWPGSCPTERQPARLNATAGSPPPRPASRVGRASIAGIRGKTSLADGVSPQAMSHLRARGPVRSFQVSLAECRCRYVSVGDGTTRLGRWTSSLR